MAPSNAVLCAGCVVVDVNKVIDAYPARDHLASILAVSPCTGGPGLNLAIDLARLGARFPIAIVGVVGHDTHGDFLRAECSRHGLDVAGLTAVDGAVTSFTDAMVEQEGGRRTFFHHVGANALLTPRLIIEQIARVRPAFVHLGAPGLHPGMDAPTPDGGNGWTKVLQAATDAGAETNLELVDLPPARLRALALGCLPLLDTIVVNELEAAALVEATPPPSSVGEDIDWDAMDAIAHAVVARGIRQLAVVHFPAGCVAADPSGRTWRQGSVRMPPARVRGTTGAGDAFAAGVVFGRREAWPVEDCLRLGVAAAAACLTDLGTTDGVHQAEDVLHEADVLGHHPA